MGKFEKQKKGEETQKRGQVLNVEFSCFENNSTFKT
jgi:hypothetical protein